MDGTKTPLIPVVTLVPVADSTGQECPQLQSGSSCISLCSTTDPLQHPGPPGLQSYQLQSPNSFLVAHQLLWVVTLFLVFVPWGLPVMFVFLSPFHCIWQGPRSDNLIDINITIFHIPLPITSATDQLWFSLLPPLSFVGQVLCLCMFLLMVSSFSHYPFLHCKGPCLGTT